MSVSLFVPTCPVSTRFEWLGVLSQKLLGIRESELLNPGSNQG